MKLAVRQDEQQLVEALPDGGVVLPALAERSIDHLTIVSLSSELKAI